MSLRRKFVISSILMFVVPVLLIAFLTAAVLAVSVLTHSSELQNMIDIDSEITEEELRPGGLLFTPIMFWGIASTAIVAATCAVVVLTLSRAILTPLKELKKAAENIRDGNLDFEVLNSKLSEINELCVAVDNMRMRLKKEVADRLAYEKERCQLLANISHDLRTPITSIKGYVEGMRDGVANTPEMQERYLNTIYAKACSMERLVDQMSDFSQLELGRMRFYYEPCSAPKFIMELAEEFRVDLESEGAILETDLPETDIMVNIDREKIRRVFLNLLSNSLKYRSERPLIVRIYASAADRGILISVKDNGRGIAKDEINRVFEGFYRGDPARTNSTRGHGLGLSISKQIIENHHGKIWIKSEENVGTEVNIYLPALRSGVLS